MDETKFEIAIREYVRFESNRIKLLAKTPAPEFKSVICTLGNMNIAAAKKLLLDGGVKQTDHILYYFKLPHYRPDDKQDIFQVLSQMKDKLKGDEGYCALPKLNLGESNNEGILYIGKTNDNFSYRFQLHMGLRTPNTYALHLQKWAPGMIDSITLHYAVIKPEYFNYLESMESALHMKLKPILGREGH